MADFLAAGRPRRACPPATRGSGPAWPPNLANDYLVPEKLRHGVYVTAWFDTALWNDPDDSRRNVAQARDRDETAAELASQAQTLRDLGLDVRSAVVYVPRPTKSARTEQPAKGAGRGRTRARQDQPSSPD